MDQRNAQRRDIRPVAQRLSAAPEAPGRRRAPAALVGRYLPLRSACGGERLRLAPTYRLPTRGNKKPPCGGCVALGLSAVMIQPLRPERPGFGCEPGERFVILRLPNHLAIMRKLPGYRFPVFDCEGFVCRSLKRRQALKGSRSLSTIGSGGLFKRGHLDTPVSFAPCAAPDP